MSVSPTMGQARAAEDWDRWFRVQAEWTASTRRWLYRQVNLEEADRVLDIGCGTGVLTQELEDRARGDVVGLDIVREMVAFTRRQTNGVATVQGDAHALPFADGTFDVIFCHYLLLWVEDPERCVQEMVRVMRGHGCVLIAAEPDYGGRIDYPPPLVRLGRLQANALRDQGADPDLGRRLGDLLSGAGLQATVGVMANQWTLPTTPDESFEAEWRTRIHDLEGTLPKRELEQLKEIDRQALESGRRILFVPTFYAIGRGSGAKSASD